MVGADTYGMDNIRMFEQFAPIRQLFLYESTVCIAATKKRQEKRTKNQRLCGFRQRTVIHSFFDYTSPTYTSKTYYFSHFKAILPTIPHSYYHNGYDSIYQFRYTKKKRRTMADSIYYDTLSETDSKKRKKEEGAFALC